MGLVTNIVFFIVLLLIWIIAGGFVTQAAVFIGQSDRDDYLNTAYHYTIAVAVITWVLVGGSIIGVIVALATGTGEAAVAAAEEALETGTLNYYILGALFVAFALTVTTGVLATLAANDIVKSSKYKSDNYKLSKSYENCIIAACLCIGATGLLIIGIIIYFVTQEQHKHKIQKLQQELKEEQTVAIKQKVAEVTSLQEQQREILLQEQAQKYEALQQQLAERQALLDSHQAEIASLKRKLNPPPSLPTNPSPVQHSTITSNQNTKLSTVSHTNF